MKRNGLRWMAVLAVLILITGLFAACAGGNTGTDTDVPSSGGNEQTATETGEAKPADVTGKFSVGYARVSIVPDYEVPLGGFGDTKVRLSKGAYDIIYETCIAITDEEGETVLIFAIDIGNLNGQMGDRIRQAVHDELGIPIDHIAVNVTHTHSACNMSDEDFNSARYRNDLKNKAPLVAAEALADRKPATMEIGRCETVGMNYVRRYLMEDGTYAGDNFGTFVNNKPVAHESEADHEIQMIRFSREGGKPVVLTNYQVHATVGSGTHSKEPIYYEISPDFIGSYRRKIETEKDCLLAYLLGGAGNINPRSKIEGETLTNDPTEYGEALADFVLDAWDTAFTSAETGKVRAVEKTVTGVVNHEDDALVAVATEVYNYWLDHNYDGTGAAKIGKPYGIESPHQANSIIGRASMGKTYNINLAAISIGSVAFAVAPYEMFDVNALTLKRNDVYDMTFVLAYGNSYVGYMPDENAYSHKGYEQAQCRFVKGTAEIFVDELMSLLKDLK